jgi:thermitase
MLATLSLAVLTSAAAGLQAPPTGLQGPLVHPRRLFVQVNPDASQAELLDAHARAGARLLRNLPQIGWQIVELQRGRLLEARERYRAEPSILRADYDRAYRLAYTPNDPYWPQWHMQKIKADVAWNTLKGAPSVRVAVLDTGLEYTHPDLASNVWTNPGEIPANGVDDDNNGYIDDVHGYDFAYDDPDPNDVFGHGTSCAGIIAAVQDNNIGVTGVAPLCQVVGLKAAIDSGYLYDSAVVPGLLYTADMGFQVVSMSFYGDGVTPAERSAIDYCWNHNVLPVAAAGNDNQVLPYYPGAYENTLSVAATEQSDLKAWFSNYGTWVDVASPGVSISTVSTGGNYTTGFAGTSAACPHTAGLAGLLYAVPGATNAKVRAAIEDTAFALDEPPYGKYVGYGRIDADAALKRMQGLTSGSKPPRFLFANPVAGAYSPFFIARKSGPRPRVTVYGVGLETPNVVRVLRNGSPIPLLKQSRQILEVEPTSFTASTMQLEVNGNVIATWQHDVDPGFVYAPTDISTQGNGSPVVTGGFLDLYRNDGTVLACTARSDGVIFVQMAIRKVLAKPISKLEFEYKRAYDNSNGATEVVDVYDWSTASYPYGTWLTLSSQTVSGTSMVTLTPQITTNPSHYVDDEGTMYVQITTSGTGANGKLRADDFRVRVR